MESVEACITAWEEIIQANSEHTGSNQHNKFLKVHKELSLLQHKYSRDRAMLLYLSFYFKADYVKELNTNGYRIYTGVGEMFDSDLSEETIQMIEKERYTESLEIAINQCENLNTRITIKQNEIKKMFKDNEASAGSKAHNMFTSLVSVGVELGIRLPEDILLAEYNEYLKQAKSKRMAQEEAIAKSKRGRK